MNNHQQDQRKKYDMQQAHIMRGGGAGTFLSMNDNHNHTTKKTVPSSSSSSSLSKDEIEKQVFKALEDLDRAEMMASRRHGEDEMIAIHQHQHQHQHQLEHARDLYRQAIGRLLEYVNYVSHNSNSNRQYDHGSGSGTSDHHPHHHDFIQIDVLKERIKLALTHAEEIQETLLQHQQQQQQQQQQRQKDNFKYKEVIRGKKQREQLHGHDCECCKGFYDALLSGKGGEVFKRDELIQQNSRHRSRYVQVDSTPKDFWEMSFPDSVEERKMASKRREESTARGSRSTAAAAAARASSFESDSDMEEEEDAESSPLIGRRQMNQGNVSSFQEKDIGTMSSPVDLSQSQTQLEQSIAY